MKKTTSFLFTFLVTGHLFAQLSFTYSVLPNERIPCFAAIWSTAGTPSGTQPGHLLWAPPQPPAPWLLEVSPDSFTTQSCADIRILRMEILAPAQPGNYTAEMKDLAAPPASDLTVNIRVTNNPTADTTINVAAMPGQEVMLVFPVKSQLSTVLLGCATKSYSPPDSLQKHHFGSPANGTWIHFTPDTLEVGPRDVLYKTVKIKSDVAGTFQTWFNRYREFRPTIRTKIIFKVQTVSAGEAGDALPWVGLPFPNPAFDIVSFPIKNIAVNSASDAVCIDMFDWSGKLVYTTTFQALQSSEDMLHCSVGQLPAGNYLYRVCFRGTGTQAHGRLWVVR